MWGNNKLAQRFEDHLLTCTKRYDETRREIEAQGATLARVETTVKAAAEAAESVKALKRGLRWILGGLLGLVAEKAIEAVIAGIHIHVGFG